MVKLAIAIQLHHVFVVGKPTLHYTIVGFATFTVAYYVSAEVVRIWQCVPREKIWNPKVDGTCTNAAALLISNGVVNAMLDFALLLVPISQTRKLQIPLKSKIAITIFFGMGVM